MELFSATTSCLLQLGMTCYDYFLRNTWAEDDTQYTRDNKSLRLVGYEIPSAHAILNAGAVLNGVLRRVPRVPFLSIPSFFF